MRKIIRTLASVSLLATLVWSAPATTAPFPMSSSRALGLSSDSDTHGESPLLVAQKLYATKRWGEAAAAYENACAVLPKVEKVPCRHWSVLALVQTGSPEDFWKASARLDTLLSMTEPENAYFAELLLTRSRLHLMQGNLHQSVRTWKMAASSAAADLQLPLYQLCDDISKQDSSLVHECPRFRPKDSTLVAVDRVRIAPNPAFRSSSSAAVLSSSSMSLSSSSSAPIPVSSAVTTAVASVVSTAPTSGKWALQLGAFGMQDNATTQVQNLKKQKIVGRIVEKAGKNRTLFLVLTGNFATKQEAQDYGQRVLVPLKLDYQPVSLP